MKKVSFEEFVTRSSETHNSFYTYHGPWINTRQKTKIECPNHGIFEQTPNHHLKGVGCPSCGRETTAKSHTYSTDQIIERIKIKHSYYEYRSFCPETKRLEIICPDHGLFIQDALIHAKGHGCKKCGHERTSKKRRISSDEFIERALFVHGKIYEYDISNYKKLASYIRIRCSEHGWFKQQCSIHVAGSQCPKCVIRWRKQDDWIDKFSNVSIKRQFSLLAGGRRYIVDGYDPDTNCVYEFWGDFWHGNPLTKNPEHINPVVGKTYGELYSQTQQKRIDILSNGYSLIEIWESEWDEDNAHR